MKKILKSLSKKTLVFSVVSIFLTAMLIIQSTGAFGFKDSSNTFSTIVISDLNITSQFLNQTGGSLNIGTAQLIPGERIARTLQISNPANSESAYIRIKSLFYIDVNTNASFETGEQSLAVQMQLAGGQTGWVTSAEGPQYWFYYNGSLNSGQTITVNLEFVVFPTEANDTYFIGNDEAGKPFKINTLVQAVQTANNGSSYANATWPTV